MHLRREIPEIFRSLVTFVALDEENKTIAVPPLLQRPNYGVQSEHEELMTRAANRKELTAAVAQEEAVIEQAAAAGELDWESIEEPWNKQALEKLAPKDTELRYSHMFMPRNLNHAGSIFGGDLIAWMEGCATHCARHFTRNDIMKTVSMNRIFFLEPIMPGDLVECVARITYTSLHTVHVRTEVTVIRGLLSTHRGGYSDGAQVGGSTGGSTKEGTAISHTGHFVIANFDRAGKPQQVTTGIDLARKGEGGDAAGIGGYAAAQCRRSSRCRRRTGS